MLAREPTVDTTRNLLHHRKPPLRGRLPLQKTRNSQPLDAADEPVWLQRSSTWMISPGSGNTSPGPAASM